MTLISLLDLPTWVYIAIYVFGVFISLVLIGYMRAKDEDDDIDVGAAFVWPMVLFVLIIIGIPTLLGYLGISLGERIHKEKEDSK